MNLFDIAGRCIVVTGGTGVLGRTMTGALLAGGARVALLTRDTSRAAVLEQMERGKGGDCAAFQADVLDRRSLEAAAGAVAERFGPAHILINGAGGNSPRATTNPQQSFFQIPEEGIRLVTELNLLGAILPSQVFGKGMAERKEGIIVNISSMNAFRPLTRIPAYSAAKAAVSNFTQWLAVHMAQEYSPSIRVNAIAPGFFLTEQNRFLLTDRETGALSARGKKIMEHTPMGRFGSPEDLVGALLWLISPASRFVTGIVVPVDGGFSAYSGV